MKKWSRVLSIFLCCLMLSIALNSGTVSASSTSGIEKAHSRKQHIVLVHGGWQGAWCWYQVENLLEKKGYEVTVLDLPGHGNDISVPGLVTFNDYVQKVTGVLDSIDGEVILVGHGTSAGVVSAVAEARPNKIEKLVFLAGVLVTNGQKIGDVLLKNTQSLAVQNSVINMNEGTVSIKDEVVNEAIYGLTPKKDIELARKLMRPEPLSPLLTPITLTNENFGRVPRYYIRTLQDKCLTPEYQKILLQTTPCKKVYELNSDHAAYFSKPKELTEILIKIAHKDKQK